MTKTAYRDGAWKRIRSNRIVRLLRVEEEDRDADRLRVLDLHALRIQSHEHFAQEVG